MCKRDSIPLSGPPCSKRNMNQTTSPKLHITPYTHTYKELWDKFVMESRNGTFLHLRDYMEYHSDRFTDHSLIFSINDRPIALLPAHIKGETLSSHGGLSYGGLILSDEATADVVLSIFDELVTYARQHCNCTKISYSPVPHIYHRYPCEEELYALFRHNAQLTERKISSTIKLQKPIPFKGRRKLTTATKNRLHIVEDDNFAAFWQILDERLKDKYGVSPVHTLQEITLLHSRFPDNILLFRVTDENGNTLGGVVMYIAGKVVHTQYTGSSHEGRRIGVLDYLYSYLIRERFSQFDYLDFGVSVEQGGKYLNRGLIAQKEGLGGRATMYDTYIINIREIHDGKEK